MFRDISSDAVFDGDDVRFHLKRWWNGNPSSEEDVPRVHPRRWAVWLMTNPALANRDRDDATTKRLNHFTKAWGFGGWIAVNIYPFVTPHPAECYRRARWENNGPDYHARNQMQRNLQYIREAALCAAIRIVAFGAEPVTRNEPWLEQCLEAFGQPSDIAGSDERFYCIGTNALGQPLHPMARGRMRVPDDAKPVLWRRP